MVIFEYQDLLYLLLLVPALAAVYLWSRYKRRKQLQKFGKPAIIKHLMPEVSQYMPAVKLTIELLIVAILVIMIARPLASISASSSDTKEEKDAKGMEIMMCIDVSNSMRASSTNDPEGVSRMQRTKLLLERLIDRLKNDKIGLIIFAGESYVQLPITNDYISAKMFINNVDPGIIATQGTAIGSAIDMAVSCFNPDSEFPKAIVVITDGENFEDDAISASRNAAKRGIRVDVIGVGTEDGAPIPLGQGRYLQYDNSQEVITKLNAKDAEEIAKAGDGVYISGNSNSAVDQLTNNLEDMGRKEYTRITHSPAAEQFPVLAWIALILMVIDVIIVTRKISWLREINFFSRDNKNAGEEKKEKEEEK